MLPRSVYCWCKNTLDVVLVGRVLSDGPLSSIIATVLRGFPIELNLISIKYADDDDLSRHHNTMLSQLVVASFLALPVLAFSSPPSGAITVGPGGKHPNLSAAMEDTSSPVSPANLRAAGH